MNTTTKLAQPLTKLFFTPSLSPSPSPSPLSSSPSQYHPHPQLVIKEKNTFQKGGKISFTPSLPPKHYSSPSSSYSSSPSHISYSPLLLSSSHFNKNSTLKVGVVNSLWGGGMGGYGRGWEGGGGVYRQGSRGISRKVKMKLQLQEEVEREIEENRKRISKFAELIEEGKPEEAEDIFIDFRVRQLITSLKPLFYDQLFYSFAEHYNFSAMKRTLIAMIEDNKPFSPSHFSLLSDVLLLSLSSPPPSPSPSSSSSTPLSYWQRIKQKRNNYNINNNNNEERASKDPNDMNNNKYAIAIRNKEQRMEDMKEMMMNGFLYHLHSRMEEDRMVENRKQWKIEEIEEYYMELHWLLGVMKEYNMKVDTSIYQHLLHSLTLQSFFLSSSSSSSSSSPPLFQSFPLLTNMADPDIIDLSQSLSSLSPPSSSSSLPSPLSPLSSSSSPFSPPPPLSSPFSSPFSSPLSSTNAGEMEMGGMRGEEMGGMSDGEEVERRIERGERGKGRREEYKEGGGKGRRIGWKEKGEEIQHNLYLLHHHLLTLYTHDNSRDKEHMKGLMKRVGDQMFRNHCERGEVQEAQGVLVGMKNLSTITATSPPTTYVQYIFMLAQHIAKEGDYPTALHIIKSTAQQYPLYILHPGDLSTLGDVYAAMIKYTLSPIPFPSDQLHLLHDNPSLLDQYKHKEEMARRHNARIIYEQAIGYVGGKEKKKEVIQMILNPNIFLYYAHHHAVKGELIETQGILSSMLDFGFHYNSLAYNTLLLAHLSHASSSSSSSSSSPKLIGQSDEGKDGEGDEEKGRRKGEITIPERKGLLMTQIKEPAPRFRFPLPSVPFFTPTTNLEVRKQDVGGVTLNDRIAALRPPKLLDDRFTLIDHPDDVLLLVEKVGVIVQQMIDRQVKITSSTVLLYLKSFVFHSLLIAPIFTDKHRERESKEKLISLHARLLLSLDDFANLNPSIKFSDHHFLELFFLYRTDCERVVKYLTQMKVEKITITTTIYQSLFFFSVRYGYVHRDRFFCEDLLQEMTSKKVEVSDDCLEKILFSLLHLCTDPLLLIKFTSLVTSRKLPLRNEKHQKMLIQSLEKFSASDSLSSLLSFLSLS